MKEESPRTAEYAKDSAYEAAVARANALLGSLSVEHEPPGKPMLIVAGLPRSGTTLLYQVLAATKGFGYCSNLVARFYRRPALGALVQTLAMPWLPQERPDFSSRAGATQGWSRPHEFGYFWEAHCPFEEHHQPPVESLDFTRLGALLGELESVVERPLLFKNVILSFVLAALARHLPTMRVVRIRRPLLDVALSIARIRRDYFDDVNAWFSVRPAETSRVLSESAPDQIAFQIARVEEALAAARRSLGADRWLDIDYAEVCAEPRDAARAVASFAGLDPAALDLDAIPEAFTPKRRAGATESADSYLKALEMAGVVGDTEPP